MAAAGRALGASTGGSPGPHAATATASGHALSYDANGNVTLLDGAALAWDAKDQLVGLERTGISAKYLYDYSDRRVAKSVRVGDRRDDTFYVDPYFEERAGGVPVKHVFAGDTRVATVEGAIDPTRELIQRVRLREGWNTVALAVESGKTLAGIFGADAAFYVWRNGTYEPRDARLVARAGEALWVHVPAARVAVCKGTYAPAVGASAVPSGGALVAWPKLESFRPRKHLSAAGRIFVHDPRAERFLVWDPTLPSFLQDLGDSLPSARALWIDATPGTKLDPEARADEAITFNHLDHLGSASVTTNRKGRSSRSSPTTRSETSVIATPLPVRRTPTTTSRPRRRMTRAASSTTARASISRRSAAL